MRSSIYARRGLFAAAAGALLVFAGSGAEAALVSITASTNAFVLRSAATADQSEASTLTTKRLNDSNTRIAYLRFDLTDFLAAGYKAADITSATLQLTPTSTTLATDTVRVFGLADSVANTATDGTSETSWTGAITFNTQPAGAVGNTSGSLPITSVTTAVLSNTTVDNAVNVVKDIPLTLAPFQDFVSADTNQQVTLMFYNTSNNNFGWASLTNSHVTAGETGYVGPTLVLEVPDAVPEPASGIVLVVGGGGGALVARRGRRDA